MHDAQGGVNKIHPTALIDSAAELDGSVTVGPYAVIGAGVHIGAGARLKHCIIDKNVVVPDWHRIGFDREEDARRYTVTESGVVVVEKGRNIGR